MASHKEKQRIFSLVANNINVVTALMFQKNGIVNIYAIYRKSSIKTFICSYFAIKHSIHLNFIFLLCVCCVERLLSAVLSLSVFLNFTRTCAV